VASPPPELWDVECAGPQLRARVRVPADLPHFAGHFPGEPLLPGVVQLEWALALARERLALAGEPCALEALKFREPLRPGQDFELRLEAGSALHFELESEGRALASGRVRCDAPPAPHAREPLSEPRPSDLPLRIPHAGAMRCIERVLAHEGATTLCRASVPDASPFCANGVAPAWLALELLAQGMAAQGGVVAADAGLRGVLVGARRIELRTRGFAAGEPLWVHVRHLRGGIGFVLAECALGVGKLPASAADARAAALARGTLTVFTWSAKD
jgi:predicted hotdog family 3-hydroxylacyl-ACP dehydratase